MAKETFAYNPAQPTAQPRPQKHQTPGFNVQGLTDQINTVSRRLKVLEERYTNIDRRIQMGEQNMLNSHRSLKKEFKATSDEIVELKKELNKIKETMKLIISELKKCAKIDDVKVIEKYINLWDPLKFVTRNQVEKIVNEILDKKG